MRYNIRKFRRYATMKDNKILIKSINMLIKISNVIETEKVCVDFKYQQQANLINLQVTVVFLVRSSIIVLLK